jgi:hypothetical protein
MIPRLGRGCGQSACLALALLLSATAPVQAAKPPAHFEQSPPRLLPGDAQAASVSARTDSWLVGAKPDGVSKRIARRFRARLLMRDTGVYRVGRGRARGFAGALKRAGRYQFSEPDAYSAAQAFPQDPLSGFQWGLGAVGALGLDPPPVSASSPLIGVLERGFDASHPDTQGIGLDGSPDPAFDAGSVLHGTAVASVASAPANGQGIVGVWPGARTTVFTSDGSCGGAVAAVVRALEAGAKVLNMSYVFLPGACFSHYIATEVAFGQGTILVAAAGNEYEYGNPAGLRPAYDPHVITVAGVNPDFSVAQFSSENLAVDLSAPASRVLAAVPGVYDQDGVRDGYMSLDGTSFAAPMVAAGAAWVAQARPDLHHTQLTDLIRISGRDLGPGGYDTTFGFGVFDLPRTLSGQAPRTDPLEPNDNVSWVNGKYFERKDAPIWRGGRVGVYLDARVDRYEDPFDVYRIVVPGRRSVSVEVTPRSGNPTLEAYNGWVRSVIPNRGRIDVSSRPGRAIERVRFRNPYGGRRVAYLSVWSRTVFAGYQLRVGRAG